MQRNDEVMMTQRVGWGPDVALLVKSRRKGAWKRGCRRRLRARRSRHGDRGRPGSEIMKPQVEGTPEVAPTARKVHVWGPGVASGGTFSLLPLGGGPWTTSVISVSL